MGRRLCPASAATVALLLLLAYVQAGCDHEAEADGSKTSVFTDSVGRALEREIQSVRDSIRRSDTSSMGDALLRRTMAGLFGHDRPPDRLDCWCTTYT